MRAFRGLTLAFALFAGSFALHIVGGATDQEWLFAIAVALIYITATGFPAIALVIAGLESGSEWQSKLTLGVGAAAGLAFTIGALWATNGRAFAWWEFLLAPVLVGASSALLLGIHRHGGRLARRSQARAGTT